jgi:hypothetical protein
VSKNSALKLRRLARFILKEPKRLNLAYWIIKADSNIEESFWLDVDTSYEKRRQQKLFWKIQEQAPPCNTIGCIAGEACIMGKLLPSEMEEGVRVMCMTDDVPLLAQEYLGINGAQACKLFYLKHWNGVNGWPVKFENELEAEIPGSLAYAQIAARRIEHFVATGE